MGKIPVRNIINQFQMMYREHWAYRWGASERGCVDCSGAFVYVYRQYGMRIAHGSNSIGRKYIIKLLPLSEAKPGMAAFKCREWRDSEKGNAWYGSEPGDLYHIGLVDDDPNYVLNAKGTNYGFCRDPISSWHYVGYLTDVNYSGGDVKMGTVVLPSGASGKTVNMRTKPSKSAPLVCRVPVGSTIEILSDQGEWCEVKYNGKAGYMMSNYIEYEGQEDHDDADPSDGVIIPSVDLERINKALVAIETAAEIIGSIVGRG